MKLFELANFLESIAPLSLQEKYDNSGIQIGSTEHEITGILLCLDLTEEVLHEAIEKQVNLIISHHPAIFSPIKSLTGATMTERLMLSAIKNNIAIYSMHTNLDNHPDGVNRKICEKLQLSNLKILSPQPGLLKKLVTFVPANHIESVRNSLFEAGAGHIGNYDCCSYNLDGTGSFRALDNTNPFIGKKGEIHYENEIRIETIFPSYQQSKIIKALIQTHPYEEVAYDVYSLDNKSTLTGAGMIGEKKELVSEQELFDELKDTFKTNFIRHSNFRNKPVQKIAVCGGSGAFLINEAKKQKADVYITADIKYHQFFEGDENTLLADIGHFESEQFTLEIFYDNLSKKFPNFAIHFSQINTNPINYY